jgi:hypothetical protein
MGVKKEQTKEQKKKVIDLIEDLFFNLKKYWRLYGQIFNRRSDAAPGWKIVKSRDLKES